MQLKQKQMEQSSIIWVLVANGEFAQTYTYHKSKKVISLYDLKRHPYDETEKHYELTPVPTMEFKAQSLSDFEGKRDELSSPQGGGEPYENICDEISQNLVSEVSKKINHYCKTKAFDNLVIVAPPKILKAFKQQLNPITRNCVIAQIDQDFTHEKGHGLRTHLEDIFAGAQVGLDQ